MEYKTVAFDPPSDRNNFLADAASSLDALIASNAVEGWEFVGVQNHSTVVPGSMGCFGIGAEPPYPKTISLVVFRR